MSRLKSYRVCNLALGSRVAFPELTIAGNRRPDWTFWLSHGPRPRLTADAWFHHWLCPDGRTWLSFARLGSAYVLRFPGMADFVVRHETRDICCHRLPGTPFRTIRHLFLNQVMPLLLSGRTRIVVHASGVVTPRGAVLFLGGSGYGKSTLGALLVTAGFPLITDDCLVLERREGRIVAVPSYPGVRLWPDSAAAVLGPAAPAGPSITHYSKKQRIWSGNRFRFCNGLPAVWRMYVLAPPDDRRASGAVTVTPMPLRGALVELLRFTYYLDVNNRNAADHAFELLGDLAGSVESRRLTYPWDLSRLNELSRAVVTDLALI